MADSVPVPVEMPLPTGRFYDLSYEGKGVKIDEVIAGGPFDNASSNVKKGCIIEKINGQEISADTDFYALLAGLTGEKVLISLSDGGKQWDEVVKPISDGACGAALPPMDRTTRRRRGPLVKRPLGIRTYRIDGRQQFPYSVL